MVDNRSTEKIGGKNVEVIGMKNPFRVDVLDKDEVDKIYEASLQILEKTGAVFNHEQALKLFHQNGAEVDFKKNLVKFPPFLVKDSIKKVRSSFSLYYQDQSKRIDIGGSNIFFGIGGCNRYIIDSETGRRRVAELRDLIDVTIIGDSSEHIDRIHPVFMPGDVPPLLVNIKQLETLLWKYYGKYIYHTLTTSSHTS